MGSASDASVAIGTAAAAKAAAAKRVSHNKVPKAPGDVRVPPHQVVRSAEFIYESRRQARLGELQLQEKEQQEERAAMVRDGVPPKAQHRRTAAGLFLALKSQEERVQTCQWRESLLGETIKQFARKSASFGCEVRHST